MRISLLGVVLLLCKSMLIIVRDKNARMLYVEGQLQRQINTMFYSRIFLVKIKKGIVTEIKDQISEPESEYEKSLMGSRQKAD